MLNSSSLKGKSSAEVIAQVPVNPLTEEGRTKSRQRTVHKLGLSLVRGLRSKMTVLAACGADLTNNHTLESLKQA